MINFKPATAVKANMYAFAQTFGVRLGIRERARNSVSISYGSGTKTTRSSAQILSHGLQASAIDFVSTPMICSGCEKLKNSDLREPTKNELAPVPPAQTRIWLSRNVYAGSTGAPARHWRQGNSTCS